MPRELVTIQVGQCGNQIGARFWELALREHAAYNAKGVYDEPLSSFFRNVDTRYEPPRPLPVGDGTGGIRCLKARSVIVDMEEGVINEMLKGPLGEVLDNQLRLSDVSGAGNNWAHGHWGYGPQYRDALLDRVTSAVEECDSLQSFLLLHSLGGGTGSGLGTYILGLLEDEFPAAFRFTASVFPSEDDDVVTSPYNALLSLAQLAEHADCVLPLENQALMDICDTLSGASRLRGAASAATPLPGAAPGAPGSKPFDAMNGLAAHALLNMTSSMRFEGSLNVDLNDITMNLVPYPRLHFLLASMSPLSLSKDLAKQAAPRSVDQVFSDALAPAHQLAKVDPRTGTYLALGLIMRGQATITDVNRNIARLRPSLRMAHWASEGFKVGLCAQPPVGMPYSLLALANNSAIAGTFTAMRDRFNKLYSRKFYAHHYEQYMEPGQFEAAAETVTDLIDQYQAVDAAARAPPPPPVRRVPKGLSFL